MKHTILTVLLLSICAFADAGDADRLAGGVLGILGLIFGLLAISVGIVTIGYIGMAVWNGCCWLWKHTTNFGKIVLFGIPMLIGFTSIFYWLIWCVAPWLYENGKIVGIISLVALYFVLVLIGWDGESGHKRDGGWISTVARVIVSIPFMSVILLFWFMKNLICKLFITRYHWTNLLDIWRYVANSDELAY